MPCLKTALLLIGAVPDPNPASPSVAEPLDSITVCFATATTVFADADPYFDCPDNLANEC